jgi:hypothetical protein
MTNDWKKNFVYYSVLALLALSTVVGIVLKLNVNPANAQGGCNVVVTGDGATCDNSGSNPGGGGSDGGNDSDTGTPGDSGGDGSNNNNDNDNSDGGSCTPGTPGEINLSVPPGSLDMPMSSVVFTLPDGTTVTGDQAPAGMCTTVSQWVDTCTGEAMGGPEGPIANNSGQFALSECPTSWVTPLPPVMNLLSIVVESHVRLTL